MSPNSDEYSQKTDKKKEEHIAIARIGKPVGLKGLCRIIPFGRTLEKIELPYKLMSGREYPERNVILEELHHSSKNQYKGIFREFNSKELIDSLKNSILFIEEKRLPQNDAEVFYHFELEGMKVVSWDSRDNIGIVVKVFNYPTVDALEVRRENGYTFIIPMTKESVKKIDAKENVIFVSDSVMEELL